MLVEGKHSLPTHCVALAGISRDVLAPSESEGGKDVMGSPSPLLAKIKDIFRVDLGLQQGQSVNPPAVPCLCSVARAHSSPHLSLGVRSQEAFGAGVTDTQRSAVGER